ncbi:MAG TPA: hypothetical protein VG937_39840, partial [Polyangiaceae bacterium]|nr:hypothetical protein [Polyangiaceae bacterium]
ADSACEATMPPLDCAYPMNQRCACKAGKWDCGVADACPPMPPQEDAPCEGKSECSYDTEACACDKGGWHCTPKAP